MALSNAEIFTLLIGTVMIASFIRSLLVSQGVVGLTKSDDAAIDPAILKRYSEHKSFHVPATGFTYSRIRTIYRKHPQADLLPAAPGPLPLFVFIHGLGGCAAQFATLYSSLIHIGSCLAIDLPGCGKSDFSPKNWPAYSTDALVHLLHVIVESHRDVEHNQGVIFIGHSMGCSLSLLLASQTGPGTGVIPQHTAGFIAMCPRAEPLPLEQEEKTKKLVRIPGFIFELIRRLDRKGGINSASVRRMVGSGADKETKRLQLAFNRRSRTPVWRRMTYGILSRSTTQGRKGGLPGRAAWESLDMPILMIGGEADIVTPPAEIRTIATYIQPSDAEPAHLRPPEHLEDPSQVKLFTTLKQPRILFSTILPAPAAHAIPYSPSTVRTVSGLIQAFLATHVDPRLSPGYQLTYLADSGKWDVKNLVKWSSTPATSEGAIGGVFLAMKTMREVDDTHCPKVFVAKWAGRVTDVVDISHESPVYDPKALREGRIGYHKFPSVSKLPPTEAEIVGFEDLIDGLRAKHDDDEDAAEKLIAVHCHYGYNRTGIFVICYLVDRLGWSLQAAIDEFARKRSPGVKHEYFLDALYVRYAAGMKYGSA